MPRDSEDKLIVPACSEEDLAKQYREELDVKLREVCALMNTALGDGFHTHFSLTKGSDGEYHYTDLYLSKRF